MSEKAELEESGWTTYFYSSLNDLGSAQQIRESNNTIRKANQDLGRANDSCLVSDASSGPPNDDGDGDYSCKKKSFCSGDTNDDADSSSNYSVRGLELQKIQPKKKKQIRWPKQIPKSNQKPVLSHHDDTNYTAESLKLQHREPRFVLDRSDQTSYASSADNFDTD